MSLDICEIFYSLQGESSFAGQPCVFIRLAGCNLACSYCDTRYAGKESFPLALDAILRKVRRFACPLVEITGGEPLLQKKTPDLIEQLLAQGLQVLVETNGSQDIAPIPVEAVRILDVKCPSSGMAGSFLMTNLNHLTATDEVKFVIGNRTDYEFATTFIHTHLTRITPERIHLAPVFSTIQPDILAQWMLEDPVCARLSLQLHKIIWDPDQRGV